MCGEWSGQLGGVLLWAARGHREGRDLAYASLRITWGVFPFLLTLTCNTLNLTPEPKPRLNAGSKLDAEHKPSP